MSRLLDRVLLLKRSPMFGLVATDDLRYIAQTLEEENFFRGDRVFEIGDQGDQMYLIETGRIGLSTSPDVTSTNWVTTLTRGDSFGEMNILDEQPRSASAHVIEDSTLLSLEKPKLDSLIRNYPEIGLGLIRALSLRLRKTNLRYERLKSGNSD